MNRKKEKGHIAVEAIVILPIAVLSTLLLLYLALFLFQRASLQAALETTLVYYKNTVTDTYVTKNAEMEYTEGSDYQVGAGNSYSASHPLSPYRGMFGDGNHLNSQKDFEKYFKSTAERILYRNDLSLTINYSNYVLLKQFEATAAQTVSSPLDFSILGIDNKYQISATARVAVVDHDSLIRNGDYAISLVKDTKLGEMARNFAGKISAAYSKLKEILGA